MALGSAPQGGSGSQPWAGDLLPSQENASGLIEGFVPNDFGRGCHERTQKLGTWHQAARVHAELRERDHLNRGPGVPALRWLPMVDPVRCLHGQNDGQGTRDLAQPST